MSKVELVFDLGSKNIRVFKKDAGLVVSEPSIAVVKNIKKSLQLDCIGHNAFAKISKLSPEEQIVYPITNGGIKNEKYATLVIREILNKIAPKTFLFRPSISVIVCVSCGLDNKDKDIIERVFKAAGAGDVTVTESPLAIGQLVGIKNFLMVDIGGSKSEIALVGEKGIMAGCSLGVAGENLNRAIIDYVANKHRVILQHHTTEKLKKTLGSMYQNDMASASVSGKAIGTNEPKTIKLFAYELREAMTPVLATIAEVVENLMMLTPLTEDLAMEIYRAGVFMSGGSCLIAGIENYFSEHLKMSVHIVEDPENAVAVGGGKFFYNKGQLASYFNLKKV